MSQAESDRKLPSPANGAVVPVESSTPAAIPDTEAARSPEQLIEEISTLLTEAANGEQRPSGAGAAAGAAGQPAPRPYEIDDEEIEEAPMPIPSTWRAISNEAPQKPWLAEQAWAATLGLLAGLIVVVPTILFLTARSGNHAAGNASTTSGGIRSVFSSVVGNRTPAVVADATIPIEFSRHRPEPLPPAPEETASTSAPAPSAASTNEQSTARPQAAAPEVPPAVASGPVSDPVSQPATDPALDVGAPPPAHSSATAKVRVQRTPAAPSAAAPAPRVVASNNGQEQATTPEAPATRPVPPVATAEQPVAAAKPPVPSEPVVKPGAQQELKAELLAATYDRTPVKSAIDGSPDQPATRGATMPGAGPIVAVASVFGRQPSAPSKVSIVQVRPLAPLGRVAAATGRPIGKPKPKPPTLADARRLVAAGRMTEARKILAQLANGGEAKALFALAETYDPNMLAALSIDGVEADARRARQFYAIALTRGVTAARQRLKALE
ncbi:MAG: hypothetical protein KDJ36_06650 [Hyphomicrobiaceae bacterium]|nr:hypothetical protein [Hyphomicrobiaceae bacterium]